MDTENNEEIQEETQEVTEETQETQEQSVDDLKAELAAKEEELTKLRDKDLNFSNLRQQKEKAEIQAKTLQEQIDEKIESAKQEIIESSNKDYYTDQLNQLAGDDEELKKKIELHYGRIKDTASTKEEMSKKLRDSWVLATAKEEEVPSSVYSSGSTGGIKTKTQENLSSEEKDLLNKLEGVGGYELTQ